MRFGIGKFANQIQTRTLQNIRLRISNRILYTFPVCYKLQQTSKSTTYKEMLLKKNRTCSNAHKCSCKSILIASLLSWAVQKMKANRTQPFSWTKHGQASIVTPYAISWIPGYMKQYNPSILYKCIRFVLQKFEYSPISDFQFTDSQPPPPIANGILQRTLVTSKATCVKTIWGQSTQIFH